MDDDVRNHSSAARVRRYRQLRGLGPDCNLVDNLGHLICAITACHFGRVAVRVLWIERRGRPSPNGMNEHDRREVRRRLLDRHLRRPRKMGPTEQALT